MSAGISGMGESPAPQPAAGAAGPVRVWTECDGRLLRLRLARPKANIVDAAMIAALDEAIVLGAENTALIAALIDHEGPHFSFGASVEEHLPQNCAAMLAALHALLSRMLFWPARSWLRRAASASAAVSNSRSPVPSSSPGRTPPSASRR